MVNEIIDDRVRRFILEQLPLVTTLFLNRVYCDDDDALQDLYEVDDIAEMIERYFCYFLVLEDGFIMSNYYPQQAWSVLPDGTKVKSAQPLTIRMFIESARARHWLYN